MSRLALALSCCVSCRSVEDGDAQTEEVVEAPAACAPWPSRKVELTRRDFEELAACLRGEADAARAARCGSTTPPEDASTDRGAQSSDACAEEEEEEDAEEQCGGGGDVVPERVSEPRKPNFTGLWIVHRLEGDFDAFLADMQQARYIRMTARGLRYGLGKVKVKCSQSGDDMSFAKTLADPRQFGDTVASFTVGQREIIIVDEIGTVVAHSSKWEGAELVFDAVAKHTKLPVQLRMYLDAQGDFVEEMISCNGTAIKYFFRRG